MTTRELKQLIKETIREELQEILREAVEIASRPSLQQEQVRANKTLRNSPPPTTISRILEETRKGMTHKEYQQIIGAGDGNDPILESTVADRPEYIQNVDLSKIPGIGKAARIYEEAQKKDRERYQ